MDERRRSLRTELEAELVMKRLDQPGFDSKAGIQVTDVSKTGVGFLCSESLEMGAVYEANLTVWTKEVIHAFIQITRIERVKDGFRYGGFFVGMNELDAYRIAVYQTVEDYKQD